MSVYFITGIDTDIGKTFATGLAARFLMQQGVRVVTQKMVQAGTSQNISDDILLHRRLMEREPFMEDMNGTTCPYVFSFPASPHLAAEMENCVIDPSVITSCTKQLLETYDVVLLEGAGGLYVPLTRDRLIADYLQERKYPLVVVTSGKLGSINHTLLTLEAAAHRQIPIAGIVFNHYPACDTRIANDSLQIFRDRLKKQERHKALVEIPMINIENISDIDFSPLFPVP